MKTFLLQVVAAALTGGMLYWFCFVLFKPRAGTDIQTCLNQHELQFTAIGKAIAFWLLLWVLPWLPADVWPWVFLPVLVGGHLISLSYWHHRVRDRVIEKLSQASADAKSEIR